MVVYDILLFLNTSGHLKLIPGFYYLNLYKKKLKSLKFLLSYVFKK